MAMEKNRISTSAYPIRCAPQHAELFKVIFCRMNNESKYELGFYPEGSVLLDGPEKYRSILKSQNEYLLNMTTFPLQNTSRQQMSLLRPKLEEHPSIKSIIPTLKTTSNGRWLIETTRKYIKQAKAHVDNTILELEGDLRENLESDGFEVIPNISLTSWGAQDISDLVKTTDIKHPDKIITPPKPNAWLRPPTMKQTTLTHTFETIKNQATPATITPNKTTKTTSNKTQATPSPPSSTPAINTKDLLTQIQSIKSEVLNQCKSYMYNEIRKLNEKQQEQNKILEDTIKKILMNKQ